MCAIFHLAPINCDTKAAGIRLPANRTNLFIKPGIQIHLPFSEASIVRDATNPTFFVVILPANPWASIERMHLSFVGIPAGHNTVTVQFIGRSSSLKAIEKFSKNRLDAEYIALTGIG